MTRNSCRFIFVLLACAAPLTAALVNAQQDNLAAGRDAPIDARRTPALADDPQTKPPLDSVDPEREAAAAHPQVAETPKTTPSARPDIDALGAEDGPDSSFAVSSRERGWILALAAAGLAASLAAAGYLAWTRSQPGSAVVAVLMPRALPQSSHKPATAPAADKEIRPERRAA